MPEYIQLESGYLNSKPESEMWERIRIGHRKRQCPGTRSWDELGPHGLHSGTRSYMSIVLSFRKSLCSGFSTSTTPHG